MKSFLKMLLKEAIPDTLRYNIKGLVSASYYVDYVFGRGKIRRLQHVALEVTMKCNCRCLMCPLYGVHTNGGRELIKLFENKQELTIEEYSDLYKDLKKIGVETMLFTGGEPFIRKDILDLIKMAKDFDFSVSITSNGGVISKDAARKLVEYGLDGLNISLDGPKPVHEYIRRAKIFDHIMDIISVIKEEKSRLGKTAPNVGFLCTVSALNQNHLVELTRVCNEKTIPLTIDPIIFFGEKVLQDTKSQLGEMEFSKEESFVMPEEIVGINVDSLIEECHNVKRTAKELGQSVYISIDNDKDMRLFLSDKDYSIVNKCFHPWYTLMINPIGVVYPCSLSVPMGNIRENSINSIINNYKFVNFRKRFKDKRLFPVCKKCCTLYSPQKYWNYLPKI